jgi:predicted dehydrogenase
VATAPSFPLPHTTRLYAGPAGASYTPIGSDVALPERLFAVPGATLNETALRSQTMPMARVFADMVRAIRSGGDGSPSFAQACHVHQIVEGIYSSIETRAWVPLNSQG